MPAFPRQSLTGAASARWIAPCGSAVAGIVAAALFLLVPQGALEDWVWRSGIAALMPAAQPPLGGTARAVLALTAGALTAAVTWSALFLLFGPDGWLAPKARQEDGLPVLRRADAHPDAPARKPLSAADLGAPMPPPSTTPSTTVVRKVARTMVQPLPVDLDQPLAAYDPSAVLPVPREPIRPVAPLRPPVALSDGERIASVQLPRSPAEAGDTPSIESLLRRLEQGARRAARV